MEQINIDEITMCSLSEFADRYANARFYYVKNGERKQISRQDAYVYLCQKNGAL